MIWVRRIFAVLLMPLFLVSFIVALFLFRVNDAALTPNFYIDRLRQADFYDFLYDELIPAGFDLATKDVDTQGVDIQVVKREVLPAIEKAVPPEWLQTQVEETLMAVFPYFTGDTDEFSITIDISTRIDATASAVKELLHGEAMDSIYNQLTEELAKQISGDDAKLELAEGMTISQQDLLEAVRTIAPKAWLVAQLENAIDAVVPYIKGTREHFTITVPLADRAQVIGAELKRLSRKSDVYTFMLDSVVNTLVEQTVALNNLLPYGIQITRQDVYDSVRQVLTREWVQAQFDGLIDVTVAYLTGKSSTLSYTIPLADRRDAAYQAVASLADQKLEQRLNALPQCSLQEFTAAVLTTPVGQLPRCRPSGVSYAQAKQLLNINVVDLVKSSLGDQIPNAWTFKEEELRDIVGPDMWQDLQDVREWVSKGYTFTDTDLRERLDTDMEARLDDALQYVRQGATFTYEDLREFIGEDEQGQDTLKNLDNARSTLHTAGQYLWVLWVWLVLLLVSIGLLGGRNLGSKIAWAASVLLFASLLTVIVTGPIYGSVARPMITTAIDDAIADAKADAISEGREWSRVEELGTRKAADIGVSVTDEFMGGIRNRAVLLLVIGALALGAGIGWQIVRPRRLPEGPSPPAEVSAPPVETVTPPTEAPPAPPSEAPPPGAPTPPAEEAAAQPPEAPPSEAAPAEAAPEAPPAVEPVKPAEVAPAPPLAEAPPAVPPPEPPKEQEPPKTP